MTCDRKLALFDEQIDFESEYLALCEVQLDSDGGLPEWIPLVPKGGEDGLVQALDGRKFYNTDPQSVVDAFNEDPRDLPLDWEHATEKVDPSVGGTAPASAWIDRMEVRDGAIWGHVKEWTPRGADSVKNKEYRYISPAVLYKKATKVITDVISAGLVNRPAFDMPAIAKSRATMAVWSTSFINDLPDISFLLVERGGKKDGEGKTVPRTLRHFPYKDASGKIDLPHLRNAIARIPQAKIQGYDAAALRRLQEKAQRLLKKTKGATASASVEDETMDRDELIAKLELDADATDEQIFASLERLKAGPTEEIKRLNGELATANAKIKDTEKELENARSANPTLDKFVPRADYDSVVAQCNSLKKEKEDDEKAAFKAEVEREVDAAMKEGKVTPQTREYHIAACSDKKGLDRFKEYAKNAPAVCDPSTLETDPKPVPNTSNRMTDEEKKIAEAFGMKTEDYLKERAEVMQAAV